jgi:hypothetical protein
MKSRYLGTVVELFTFPLVVLLFLGGRRQAALGHPSWRCGRVGYRLTVTGLLSQQIVGYTLEDAVKQFGLNNLGVQRIKQVYSECEGLSRRSLFGVLGQQRPTRCGPSIKSGGTKRQHQLWPPGSFAESALRLAPSHRPLAIGDVGSGFTARGLQRRFCQRHAGPTAAPDSDHSSMGCSGPSSTWSKPRC